ncbi:MAG: pSer/pThr/pTyr-binding forkhead associated (FHA) protein [Planctomycetota bacterium]|jgi:pSer/pThr/pTyr-binding forkhead associated (FHA) protein
MQDRFTLRFQNGEREGDTVSITAPRFSLGRRPGNTLQIQDGSVSGKHAEFVVEPGGVTLRDLGSTNSTKVAGEKISESRLAHGDVVSFGNITAVFEDAEFLDSPKGAPAPAPAVSSPTLENNEGVARVSADLIARSGKRSKTALIGFIVLLLVGGGAGAFFFTGGGGRVGRKLNPVVEVDGNRIAGYSFEGESLPANWSSPDSAPSNFSQRGEARLSGEDGMRAILSAGQWALLQSDPVAVSVGRALEVKGMLRARSRSAGRLGIEFLGDKNAAEMAAGSSIAWSAWVADVTRHQEISFVAPVPAGCRSARVVVEARAQDSTGTGTEEEPEEGGSVDVDDVSLVETSGAGTPAKVGEYSLWSHGDPAGVLQLTKVSRSLIGDLRASGSVRLRDYPLSTSPSDTGFQINLGSADAISFRVEPTAAEKGIASITASGFQEHSGDFEQSGIVHLLVGSGHDLVAFSSTGEMTVKGHREGAGMRIALQTTDSNLGLQVDFHTERALAGDLAFAARKAESNGELGECVKQWNSLLVDAPFEEALVQEARATRSRIEQAGLVELAEVKETLGQADFFRLVDLFRQCRSRAQAVGAKYAGSAVETQSKELVARIEESLSGLEADLSRDEVARLNSILSILERMESERLAGEVSSYINEEFGGSN